MVPYPPHPLASRVTHWGLRLISPWWKLARRVLHMQHLGVHFKMVLERDGKEGW